MKKRYFVQRWNIFDWTVMVSAWLQAVFIRKIIALPHPYVWIIMVAPLLMTAWIINTVRQLKKMENEFKKLKKELYDENSTEI